MKASKAFFFILICSFLLGVGLISFTPVNVSATGVPGPGPTLCDRSCYEISCYPHASCSGPGTEKMHEKCYGNAMLADPCATPLSCGCVDIGCGPECSIT